MFYFYNYKFYTSNENMKLIFFSIFDHLEEEIKEEAI